MPGVVCTARRQGVGVSVGEGVSVGVSTGVVGDGVELSRVGVMVEVGVVVPVG